MVMDLVPYRVRACISCSSLEIEVNARAGDVVCGNCGVVQCERLLDSRDEVRIYEDDGGKKSSRTSGFADSFGNDSLVLVGGLEKDRQSFDRAQRAMANRKVNTVLSHLMVINGLSSRMNLTPSIQVSVKAIISS